MSAGVAASLIRWSKAALLHGSGDEMTWSLPMAQSCEAKDVWFGDADHAVESMYGDRGLACLSVV